MRPSRPLLRTPRRWFPLALAVCVMGAGVFAPAGSALPAVAGAPAATSAPTADPGLESQFVNRINSLRASKGLHQLSVDGQLQGVARRWTDRMVAAGQISHNPNLASEVSSNWSKLGENVGVGYDVDGLMQAFINSPAHYKNLVDPEWTQVAVGVTVASDGRIYTTHNFMAIAGQAPPPSPPAPAPTQPPSSGPPPATGPAPTTTTTTAPPPPPEPEPTPERVTAVLDPLRSLEAE